jgi:predicted AlkP superfamily pyrophosphatase or phosphodiesterase
MVTGACPERSGIDRWENRDMRTDDAISLALRNGISAAWIDGPRPPVSLRQGVVRVSDTNGDGSFDDEITDRAAADYENGTRLLYVHLADTDRTLHAYGPYAPQSLDSTARADAMIGRLAGSLRPGTLLIVVSDHGGHAIAGGRGDHGSLLPEDMLIPLAIRLC